MQSNWSCELYLYKTEQKEKENKEKGSQSQKKTTAIWLAHGNISMLNTLIFDYVNGIHGSHSQYTNIANCKVWARCVWAKMLMHFIHYTKCRQIILYSADDDCGIGSEKTKESNQYASIIHIKSNIFMWKYNRMEDEKKNRVCKRYQRGWRRIG